MLLRNRIHIGAIGLLRGQMGGEGGWRQTDTICQIAEGESRVKALYRVAMIGFHQENQMAFQSTKNRIICHEICYDKLVQMVQGR